MTSLTNVELTALETVMKPHLKGKPLYIAVFVDPLTGTEVKAEVGLRQPDPDLYKVGSKYDIETEEKFGSARLKGIALTGQALGPPQAPAALGGNWKSKNDKERGGKVFPIPLLHGDRSVVRQNSLRHAALLVSGLVARLSKTTGMTNEQVVDRTVLMARAFERYSCGDAEREAAEQARGE